MYSVVIFFWEYVTSSLALFVEHDSADIAPSLTDDTASDFSVSVLTEWSLTPMAAAS